MDVYRSLGTLGKVIADIQWPVDFFSPEDLPDFLNKIYVLDYWYQQTANGIATGMSLAFEGELSIKMPGLDGISFVAGGDIAGFTFLNASIKFAEVSVLTLSDISLALRFDKGALKPATFDGSLPEKEYTEISVTGSISIDSRMNISVDGFDALKLTPCMIGDSGVIISADDVKLDLSRGSSIPEVINAGFDESFIGVYMGEVRIKLPDSFSVDLPKELFITDCAIGTGGFTGNIDLSWTPGLNSGRNGFTGEGSGELFGIPFALTRFNVSFKQNTITGSEIKGMLILPFFDQPVSVDLGLTTGGDFTIALSAVQTFPVDMSQPRQEDGLFVFKKEGLLELKVRGLEFARHSGDLMVSVSGGIKPLISADTIKWPEFNVEALSIDSKGHIKLDGGWLDIPNQKSLSFYGFAANLTKIGFGKEEDGRRWIGLSGGISIVDGVPMKGSVEGLKIIWDPAKLGQLDAVDFELAGIGVGFEIKDVLKLDGAVAFIREEGKSGFMGGVSLVLYPLNFTLDAQFMAGKNEKANPYKFFYTALEAQLPVGIPLFSTGLAIFGMAGLFGYNMEPTKGDPKYNANETWYEWYKSEPQGVSKIGGVGSQRKKWDDERGSMAFGAGITFGTLSDNGNTFAAKTMLVFLIPGPVIIIEGKANFLKDRSQLGDNAIFKVLAVFDNRAGIFLMNLEANYVYPEPEGNVLSIHGLAEAFFDFNNSSNWHLYIGQEEQEKRIRAEVIKFFEANAYFMLNNKSLVLGSWIGYDNKWKFGPLSVILEAWIEGRASVTFKPIQAEGSLLLHGKVGLKAFKFGLNLSVDADFQVKTPKPFYVHAGFDVKIDLPWPLPDAKAKVELEWKEEVEPPVPMVLSSVGIEHIKTTEKWTLDIYPDYDTDNDGFRNIDKPSGQPGNLTALPVIPLDAKPVIVFARPVEDVSDISNRAYPAPVPETVGKYTYKYRLVDVILEKSPVTGGVWTACDRRKVHGKWQAVSDGGKLANTKLMLWARTEYEIARELARNDIWLGGLGDIKDPDSNLEDKLINVDFEDKVPETYLPAAFAEEDGTIFLCDYPAKIVEYKAPWGTRNALLLDSSNSYKPARTVNADFAKYIGKVFNNPFTLEDVKFLVFWSDEPAKQVEVMDVNGIGGILIDNFTELQVPPSTRVDVKLHFSWPVHITAYSGSKIVGAVTAKQTASDWTDASYSIQGSEIDRLVFMVDERFTAYLMAVSHELPEQAASSVSSVQIVFPETLHELEISLGEGANVAIEAFDERQQVILNKNLSIPAGTVDIEPVKLNGGIRQLSISGDALLSRLAYITEAAYKDYMEYIERQAHYKDLMEEHWAKHEQDLLEPDMYYKIVVKTEVLKGDVPYTYEECAYFRTDKPPGVYAAGLESGDHYPAGGLLKDLSVYVDKTIPSPGQKGVYSSYDAGVVYNESYVEQMYLQADMHLYIKLFDNNGKPVVDLEGNEVQLDNQWGDNPKVTLTREEEQWIMTVNKSGAAHIDYTKKPPATNLRINGAYLKPETMYTAKVVAVNNKDNGSYPLYQFSFITSKYAAFTHHVHSFKDAAWSLGRLTGLTALNQASKTAVESILSGASAGNKYAKDAEAAMFERLVQQFGIDTCRLPEGVEVTALDDSTRSYGLLLESPEPIDWLRTSLKVSYAAKSHVLSTNTTLVEAVGPLKIIGASLQNSNEAGADYKNEWIDILVTQECDISGFTVEHRGFELLTPGVELGEAEYTPIYTFGTEKRLPAGAVIRIHTCKPADDTNPSRELEHRYLSLEEPQLLSLGEKIRLRDAKGNIVHTRPILSADAFTEKGAIYVRNADGTRAFVFFPAAGEKAGQTENGNYRLSFTFKRNIGNEQPILKRLGSDAAEETYIEFSYPAVL